MAKTTEHRGKRNAKDGASGPVLVDESEEIEQEHETDEEETTEPPEITDPRRIPPLQSFDIEHQAQFFAFLGQFPDPSSPDLYCYRLFPVISVLPPADWVSNAKPPTHIFKLKGIVTAETNQIVTYEWLRDTWGSGKYELRLIDRRIKRTQNRQICRAVVEVNEYNSHLPVLNDWSELLPVEGNKWLIQKLTKEKIIKRNPEGGFMAYDTGSEKNGSAPDAAAQLRETVNIAKDLAKTMSPATQSLGSKDILDLPGKIMESAKGIVEISKPAKQDNGLAELMLAQLATEREERKAAREREREERTAQEKREADDRKEAAAERAAARERELKWLERLLEQKNAPAPSATDELEKLGKVIETVDKIRGGEDSPAVKQSRMNGWQEFTTEMVKAFAPGVNQMLGVFGTFMNMRMTQQMRQQPPGQQQPRPTAQPTPPGASPQVAPPPQTAAQPSPAQPEPAPQGPEPSQEQQQPPMNKQQAEAHIIMTGLASVAPTLIKYFEDAELSGEDFAMWFCDAAMPTGLPYPELIDGIQAFPVLKQYTPEQIRELVKVNAPPLYARIAPMPDKEEALLKFLTEFLEYDPNAAEDNDK